MAIEGLNELPAQTAGVAKPSWNHRRAAAWTAWTFVVSAVFGFTLAELVVHSARSELYSYIPLVPFMSGYLIYLRRSTLPADYRTSSVGVVGLAVAVAAVAASRLWRAGLSLNDQLALETMAYVCFVAGGGFLFLGRRWMAAAAFPMAFLFFLVPLPDAAVRLLENASVLASADVSAALFTLTGTPFVRDDTVFRLPGIALEIARECSGINSTWVLFIVGLVASNLLLRTTGGRLLLVAFIIPLAIVRNSVRILTIGLLCVHVGPHMIDSSIHRSGGPIFFAASLVPLFLLLVWLRRLQR
jgi:exosortase C (VPDSG-CTERM-specific)